MHHWFNNILSSSPISSLSSSLSSSSSGDEAPTLSDMARQIRSSLKHNYQNNPELRAEFCAWIEADVGSYGLGSRRGVDRYVNLHPGLQREVSMNIRGLYNLTVEMYDDSPELARDEIAKRIARLRALHSPGRRGRSASVQSTASMQSNSSIETTSSDGER